MRKNIIFLLILSAASLLLFFHDFKTPTESIFHEAHLKTQHKGLFKKTNLTKDVIVEKEEPTELHDDHSHEHQASSSFKKKSKSQVLSANDKNEKEPLSDWLQNSSRSVESRVAKMTGLENNQRIRQNIVQLVVSENPHKHKDISPHTHGEYLYKQEAALRVHGMRWLANKVSNDIEFNTSFKNIIENSSDETIRNIAMEVLDYKKRGRSFFKDSIAAIAQSKVPQD